MRLEKSGYLHLLDSVIISEEAGVWKPDPEIIRLGMRNLGCTDPHQAVMMGDSLTSDIAAARAAGIDSIRLGAYDESATFCVKTLKEAEALLIRN